MTSPTRAYQPSDIIQDNVEPFAKVLCRGYKAEVCDNCFKSGKAMKRCNNCKFMFYCDRKCQNEDWKKGHKVECPHPYFKKLIDEEEEAFEDHEKMFALSSERQILRIWSLLKLKPHLTEKKVPVVHKGITISFNDIVEKYKRLLQEHPLLVPVATKAAEEINKGSSECIEVKALVDILIVMNTTCVEMVDQTGTTGIGFGFYLPVAAFDHSCKPNTHLSTFGAKHNIRAIAPIEAGQVPTMCIFGDSLLPLEERQKTLQESFEIECKCPLCAAKADEGFDYEGLIHNIRKLQAAEVGIENDLSFSEVLELKDKTLSQLLVLSYEFDKRVSSLYYMTFCALLYCPLQEDELEARSQFMEVAKLKWSTTFGDKFLEQDWLKNCMDIVSGEKEIVAIPVSHLLQTELLQLEPATAARATQESEQAEQSLQVEVSKSTDESADENTLTQQFYCLVLAERNNQPRAELGSVEGEVNEKKAISLGEGQTGVDEDKLPGHLNKEKDSRDTDTNMDVKNGEDLPVLQDLPQTDTDIDENGEDGLPLLQDPLSPPICLMYIPEHGQDSEAAETFKALFENDEAMASIFSAGNNVETEVAGGDAKSENGSINMDSLD